MPTVHYTVHPYTFSDEFWGVEVDFDVLLVAKWEWDVREEYSPNLHPFNPENPTDVPCWRLKALYLSDPLPEGVTHGSSEWTPFLVQAEDSNFYLLGPDILEGLRSDADAEAIELALIHHERENS